MTTRTAAPLAPSALRGLRRTAVIVIIASLVISAAIGIVTVLTGDFGEVQSDILLTTLTIAAFSITALCHLAVAGRAIRVVGFVGIAVSAVAVLCAVVLIWSDWSFGSDSEWWFKGLFVGSILAVSLAQTNLLLLLAERTSTIVRYGLWATIAFIGVLAVLGILPIITDGDIPGDNGDTYARVVVVVAILDALGTIALPVIARFVREPGAAAHELVVRGAVAQRVSELARSRGQSPEAVIEELLDGAAE